MNDDPPVFDFFAGRPELPIQKHQPPKKPAQLSPGPPEMRNQLAGVSPEKQIPDETVLGVAHILLGIGLICFALFGLVWTFAGTILEGIFNFAGMVAALVAVACIAFPWLPGIVALILVFWLVGSLIESSMRCAVRKELERQEKKRK